MQQDPLHDTLPALGAKGANGTALLTHARNENLSVENGVVYYINRAKPSPRPIGLTGITRPLHDLYWPSYSPFHGRSGTKEGKKKRNRPQWTTPSESKPASRLQSAQELARANVRGSIVHRQIGEYMRFDPKHFAIRNPSGLHSLGTVAILAVLQNAYVPIAFEFPVACEDAYTGTPIDMIGVHEKTGRLGFFEIKTSKSRELFVQDDPTVPFVGSLATLAKGEPRSACTRARVQLGLSVAMLVQGHGLKSQDFDAYVLLLSEEGPENAPTAEFFDVSESFLLNVAAPLYVDFVAQVPKWREEQKKERKRRRELFQKASVLY